MGKMHCTLFEAGKNLEQAKAIGNVVLLAFWQSVYNRLYTEIFGK
jgi:hypothetical protein